MSIKVVPQIPYLKEAKVKKIWGGTDWYDPINKVKCKFYTLDAFCLKKSDQKYRFL